MKIFCIGRNYAAHAAEMNSKVPSEPLVFMKPSTALLTGNRSFFYPSFSQEIHHEIEVVLKVCKNGKAVQSKFAKDYFQEITLGIDFTARDLQAQCKQKGHPWEIAKAFDHSAALGKWRSITEFADLTSLGFELKRNDQSVQKGNTTDLIFSFETLICHLSKYFTLQKGDLIFTGTPSGVGPIAKGDILTGLLDGEQVFSFKIE